MTLKGGVYIPHSQITHPSLVMGKVNEFTKHAWEIFKIPDALMVELGRFDLIKSTFFLDFGKYVSPAEGMTTTLNNNSIRYSNNNLEVEDKNHISGKRALG